MGLFYMDKVLENVSDTILDKEVTLEVDIYRTRWEKFLRKPEKRTFVIKPITLGSLIRISKLLLTVDLTLDDVQSLLQSTYHSMVDHGETIAKIIAIAIHNQPTEPPKSLVDFIINNFTAKEMFTTVSIILNKMDVTSFMSSIISIKGMSVLEMQQHASAKAAKQSEVSPLSTGGIIAPGV